MDSLTLSNETSAVVSTHTTFLLIFWINLGDLSTNSGSNTNSFWSKSARQNGGEFKFWITKCLHILGTSISFRQFRTIPTTAPVLIISNHQSMWDISPIIWKLSKNRTKYIAKASLARFIPSISYNLKYGGSVAIDRNDPAGSILKIKEFAHFIQKNNFAIVIYPEGSRNIEGKVQKV